MYLRERFGLHGEYGKKDPSSILALDDETYKRAKFHHMASKDFMSSLEGMHTKLDRKLSERNRSLIMNWAWYDADLHMATAAAFEEEGPQLREIPDTMEAYFSHNFYPGAARAGLIVGSFVTDRLCDIGVFKLGADFKYSPVLRSGDKMTSLHEHTQTWADDHAQRFVDALGQGLTHDGIGMPFDGASR